MDVHILDEAFHLFTPIYIGIITRIAVAYNIVLRMFIKFLFLILILNWNFELLIKIFKLKFNLQVSHNYTVYYYNVKLMLRYIIDGLSRIFC